MEPTPYVSPAGALQTVAAPEVAERLRAAGWRPHAELVALAPNDPTAAAHLKRAEDYQKERQAEQDAREARYAPAPDADAQDAAPEPAQAAEAEPAQADEAEAEPAGRKRRAGARS